MIGRVTGFLVSVCALAVLGSAQLTDFPADMPHGTTAYRHAVRAPANCMENLRVYGAIALEVARHAGA